jgi:hypothetical protein
MEAKLQSSNSGTERKALKSSISAVASTVLAGMNSHTGRLLHLGGTLDAALFQQGLEGRSNGFGL